MDEESHGTHSGSPWESVLHLYMSWKPSGNHGDSYGSRMECVWNSCGIQMKSVWVHMESIWSVTTDSDEVYM
eukprot:4558730-Karenia_brevis.AAC.1